MSKTLTEVLNELKGNAVYTSTGKAKKSFSRTDFDKLAKAYVNETELEVIKVQKKGDDLVETAIHPVKGFREIVEKILRDFGVDKSEAARVLDSSYQIKSVAGLYEFVSELVYTYIDAGKKFDFITKEDFIGGIALDEVEEIKDKPYRMVDADKNVKSETLVTFGKHKELVKKSKCPEWKKVSKKK